MLFTLRVFNSLVPVLTSFWPAYTFLPFILNWCNIIAPLTLIHQLLSALFFTYLAHCDAYGLTLHLLYYLYFLSVVGIYCTNVQYILYIHTDEARPWAEYSAMQFHELFQKYYFRWPCAYNKNNAPDTVGLKKDFIIHKNISKTFN